MELNWQPSPHSKDFERADAGDGLTLERHHGDKLVHAILNKERIPVMFESGEAAISWRSDGFRAARAMFDAETREHPGGRGKKPLGMKP